MLDNKDLENLSFSYTTIKNYVKALEYIKKLALKDPSNSEWQTRIAYLEDMNYNKEEAQKMYTEAYKKDPNNPINAWYYVGRVLWFDFDKKEAREEAKTILNKIIENPTTINYKLLLERSYNMLGYVCEAESNSQIDKTTYLELECAPLYKKSLEINPSFYETYTAIARTYIKLFANIHGGVYITLINNVTEQKYQEYNGLALSYLDHGLKLFKNSDGLFLLGIIKEAQNQYKTSEGDYLSALAIQNEPGAMLQSENDNLKGVIYIHLATLYLKQNQEQKAIEAIKNMKKYYQYTDIPKVIENLAKNGKKDKTLQKLNELIVNN